MKHFYSVKNILLIVIMLSLTLSVDVCIVVAVPNISTLPVIITLPFTVPPVLSNLESYSVCKFIISLIGCV